MDTTTLKIMRYLVMVAIVLLSIAYLKQSFAAGAVIGPDCTFTWQHDAATAATVTGSKVYVGDEPNDANPVSVDVGNVTTATCQGIGITNSGQYYARVTAYNTVGESGFSNEVPFVLVTAPPGAPSLTVQ